MRQILVIGGGGMLGEAVVKAFVEQLVPVACIVHRSDFGGGFAVWRQMLTADDDATIVNCAGLIPSRPDWKPTNAIEANTILPQFIAERANGARVIHVSTDCVFGRDQSCGPHSLACRPAPDDLYGRSKLAGEVPAPHVTNVRTSFVGPRHGLWSWLAAQPQGATVEGWADAWWSGSTVDAVARALVGMAVSEMPLPNVVHLATAHPISKYQALTLLAQRLGRDDLTIVPGGPFVGRDLAPSGCEPLPSLADALAVDFAAEALR